MRFSRGVVGVRRRSRCGPTLASRARTATGAVSSIAGPTLRRAMTAKTVQQNTQISSVVGTRRDERTQARTTRQISNPQLMVSTIVNSVGFHSLMWIPAEFLKRIGRRNESRP